MTTVALSDVWLALSGVRQGVPHGIGGLLFTSAQGIRENLRDRVVHFPCYFIEPRDGLRLFIVFQKLKARRTFGSRANEGLLTYFKILCY